MKESLIQVLKAEQKKRIVVYGLPQKKCKAIKKALCEFKVYFMDLDAASEEGAEWLESLEQAAACEVDAFVVMRQMIADRNSFQLLMDYCKAYHADIYDADGRNIGAVCQRALDVSHCSRKCIQKAIEEHDNISFDIFDTLLMRKVLFPEDVFELTARRLRKLGVVIKGFREKRIKAQEELGLKNPDIYEIYTKFQKKYKVTEELAALCRRTEMEVEAEVLVPRQDMIEIYRQCINMGKRVSLVSDMYIPETILAPILKKNGVTGYSNLYISCDRKQLKLQGLLETYRSENVGESFLHIGDHLIYDGICAELAGLEYCLVESGYKMAQRTMLRESINKAETLEEHIMLGMVIARIMNSPFCVINAQGGIGIESDYDYGYGFCAALISQFALWIYHKVRKGKYDDILFASRDGYLIQQMYEVLLDMRHEGDMPKGLYFYTSRKAAVMTGINNEAYINMIIDISCGMPPKKMMRERFGLSSSKILNYDMEKYGDSIHKYVWEHAEAIFERADIAKKNYYKYMGNINLGIGKKYAFMDFVSSGTSQKSLSRMAPFEIKGLYAGWNGTDSKEELGIETLFEQKTTAFMRRYKMMETFMTSEEPSLSYFNEDGNPVFSYQDRTEQELEYVRKMQGACMDYFKEFLAMIDPEENSIHNEFTDSIFAASEKSKINDSESVLNHLRLMDDWRKKRNKIEELFR